MSWYKEGSVNIEQGSYIVTGIGTKWTNPLIGVRAGQMLILKTANTIEIYEIASVQSDTQLTLANQYSGTTQTGVSYEIPTAPKISIEALALRISEMLNYYQQQMNGWQSILTGTSDITLTAPDGRVVTIKSQTALTEAIDNAIKKSGEENQSINGSLDAKKLTENGVRVYSPDNKPSADDIGALAATKTIVNGVPTYKVGDLVDFKSRPTVDNSFVTTTDQFVNKFEQFGFQKLPSGLIIQWGLTEYFSTSQDVGTTQSFYTTFPNACFLILTSDGYSGVHSTSACAISASQFKCWGRNPLGNYSDTRLFYMAIGF